MKAEITPAESNKEGSCKKRGAELHQRHEVMSHFVVPSGQLLRSLNVSSDQECRYQPALRHGICLLQRILLAQHTHGDLTRSTTTQTREKQRIRYIFFLRTLKTHTVMIRIIVVDDPNSAQDIQNQLQRMSYDVIALTSTADEVITRADELRPDIILMDVKLKGAIDGIEVAQQIKSLHDIPIILTTANADEATVRRVIAADLDGFLVKPLDELELRGAIGMAIHKHRMEINARESDRRMRELTESLSEVIFETDMAGNITFINRAGLKEFGYTKEQVEGGMTLYDFISPDKQEEIRESIAQAGFGEPSEWIEVPGLRRDGSTFAASACASVIVRDSVPVGIRGIALNVTQQKRAEQKLREGEKRIREITDALPVVFYQTDATGRVTFVNAAAFDLFGYTKEKLEARMSLFQLIVPGEREHARLAS